MKNSFLAVIIPVVLVIYSHSVNSQSNPELKKIVHYVLPDFEEGTVILKSGLSYQVQLNYNTLTEEMVFIRDGNYLALNRLYEVRKVNVGGKEFIPYSKYFFEVLSGTETVLLKRNKSIASTTGSDTGFGNSRSSATEDYSSIIGSGGFYKLNLPDNLKVTSQNEYWVMKNGEFIKLKNVKHFRNVFPDKAQLINSHMKSMKVTFNNEDSLIDLFNLIALP
jgi:hypothetical protein